MLEHLTDVRADLGTVVEHAAGALVERYEGFQAGGGGIVAKRPVILDGVEIRLAEGALAATFARDGAQLEATSGAWGLPADWQGYDHLQLSVVNGAMPVTLDLVIVGARCRIIETRALAAHEAAALDIDLIDLPLAAGIRPLYEPTGVRLVARWEGDGARTVTVTALRLTPGTPGVVRPCVDRFGQRVHGRWPGKVTDWQQVLDYRDEEARELAAMAPLPDRDCYGGWTGGPTFAATGFFHVAQDDGGRWWFVDPLGNPFWSVGITCIRTTDATPVAGREFLYEELPDPHGPHAAAYIDGHLSPYRWNILRKWGSPEAWKARVLQRLQCWGMNTVACWSEELLLQQQQVPHVRFFRARTEQGPKASRAFPDVFDPAWEALVESLCIEHVVPYKDDPWLIGHFVDNEAPWRSMRLLDAPEDGALRDAWLAFVQERYASPEAFNRIWGANCATWAQVRTLTDAQVPADGPARGDMQLFETRYAERYFSTIARLVKQYDPNHLYMGCRFVRIPPHESIVAVAGRYCDVLSVNCYALYPDREAFTAWHRMAGGKPIVIGEHHLPLQSARQLPPLYQAFTAEERRVGYVKFLREFAAMPFSLGCHWYQHADQALTGRPSDGEDQTIGMVDITDHPHAELVEAVREVTAGIYPWHAVAQ